MSHSKTTAFAKVGIVAGGGDLPRRLISACQAKGQDVFVLALEGYAETITVDGVDHAWCRLGALGKAFKILKDAGVRDVVFAGSVKRPSLSHLRPDARGATFLARIGSKALGDDGLLRAVGEEFEKEGLTLRGAHEIFSDLLAQEGSYSTRLPSEGNARDITRAFEVAKGIGALDVGQGAVVQDGIVLAVEAVEGTDKMLQRCADLKREGEGGVLVKVSKPEQDRRLDLPTIGVDTVVSAANAGLSGIAIEANSALVLDPDGIRQKADELDVFVQGIGAGIQSPLIYIIAGEPSGDILGARLMQALQERSHGQIRFAGVGGESMAAAGITSLFPQSDIAVMGFAEVLPKIPVVLRRVKEVVSDIQKRKPAVIVTIDSLGFNKRIAKALIKKNSQIPRVHYVAPMVWAWKPKRAETIAQLFDHQMCLLGFEPPYFEKHGIATTHVGHPVIESGIGQVDVADFRARHGLEPDDQVLCLLPGSRQNEVSRMLPIFEKAAEILRRDHPDLKIIIPTVATVADYVLQTTRGWKVRPIIVRGEQERWAAFGVATGAIATSGTVSLELARANVPFVIGYKANPASAWLARKLIKIKYATLINYVRDRMVIPEFIQDECSPENLASALAPYLDVGLDRESYLAEIKSGLCEVVGPYERPSLIAADVVLKAAGVDLAQAES